MKAILKSCLFIALYAISLMLFVSSCDDDDELEIQYPETGLWRQYFDEGKTDYTSERNSLQAKLPGGKLKGYNYWVVGYVYTNYMSGIWYYEAGSSNNL
jgi:hypothetical protein